MTHSHKSKKTDATNPTAELRQRCEAMRDFNTTVCDAHYDELIRLAKKVPAKDFPHFAEFANALLLNFAQTPWKVAARDTMAKLAARMEAAQKRLTDENSIPSVQDENAPQKGTSPPTPEHSVALATQGAFPSLEWIQLLEEAQPPTALQNSVDALINRNNLTETVFKTLFEILYHIDANLADQWMHSYLTEHRGKLDQDIVRDVLRCWLTRNTLSTMALNWTLEWAADEELRHQWPMISRLADHILRQDALTRHLARTADSRRTLIRRLNQMIRSGDASKESALKAWTIEAVEQIGAHIQAFSCLITNSDEAKKSNWMSKALREELAAVNDLLPPILLLADLALAETNGSSRLAMALIGLPEPELERWRDALEQETKMFITKTFINDLRKGQKPEASIRAFCLGDTELFRQMISDLDILTREFESIKQRDKITAQLATHYASFRERHKLPKEITRRYRLLMQTLHQDALARLLSPEDAHYVAALPNLPELASAAADARRFLTRHNAWEDTLQQLLAARLDFDKSVRKRRLRLIHLTL